MVELITQILAVNKIWQSEDTDTAYNVLCIKSDLIYNLNFIQRNTICLFNQCVDLIIYDRPGLKYRFVVIYILRSLTYHTFLYVYTQTNEIEPILSLCELYKSIVWSEREVWDLFGVSFVGHPDLRRLITDYGFSGHPLRKDFPLTGYYEVGYNVNTLELIYQKIELTQEYRSFYYSRLF